MNTVRIVKRPDIPYTGGRSPDYPTPAILATLGTDRAVVVPLEGRPWRRVANSIGKRVKARGLRFRHKLQKDDTLICWVEKRA